MRCAMRLMPLLLACLMLGQAVAARNLLNEWDPAKKQFLQIAVTYSGKCSDVDAARLLRDNAVADVKAYFVRKSKQSIADSVIGRLDTVCQDKKEGSSNLASFRTAVNWIGLDNTDDRQTLFRAANRNACTGGISPTNFAKLIAASNTADYSIKYNAAGVWNPNSKRGPIPYVDATNCNGTAPPPPASPAPASPAPASPAPASPAPVSPAPASPAPASPSPAPLNCSALIPNSVDDGTGKCVCTGAGFQLSALNGTTLAACLATTTTTCPTAYPIPAKDSNSNIKLCQANINACPAEYPFFLVAGDPAAIVECRPAGTPCTISGFTVQVVVSASGNVVGCVKNDGQCPSAYPVAYREAASSFQLQKCDNAASCPALVIPVPATPTRFTTSARTASGQLVGCFTLAYVNAVAASQRAGICPAIPAANFPINVVSADPDPAATATPSFKTLSCLAPNSTCPSSNPIQLFAQTTAGAPPTVATCALTSVLSSGNCPGAVPAAYPIPGPYSVRIGPSDQLLGCSSSTDVCPVAFPFPTQSGSTITRCSPTGSTTSCTGGSIPAVDIAGNTVACLGVIATCTNPDYPIEVRNGAGDLLECRAQGASCPATGSSFPFYAATAADKPATLVQCRPKLSQDTCVIGIYTVPIYTSDTTTNANLVGCVSSVSATTKLCPTAYPVAYRDSADNLKQCRPSTIAACPAAATPPTALSIFSTKAVDATGKILACLQLASPATGCPGSYPVAVKQVSTSTAFADAVVVQCMPKGTTTCPADYPFTLWDTASAPVAVGGCVQPEAVAACNDQTTPLAPALAADILTNYAGTPIYGPTGTVLRGCTKPTPSACPSTYIAFVDATPVAPVIDSCRTSISTTCSEANPTYSVSGRNAAGAVAACIKLAAAAIACPATYPIEVTPVLLTPAPAQLTPQPTDCLAQGAVCPAEAVNPDGTKYFPTFSLYLGPDITKPGRVALLSRCLPPVTGNDQAPVKVCAGNYGASYNVPVYSDAAGTILVGCLEGVLAGSTSTPCPASTLAILPKTGAAIVECRGGRTDCTFSATTSTSGKVFSTYKTQVRDANNVLQACEEQAVDTQCPLVAGSILPVAYPFALLGPGTSGTDPVVAQCRPVLLNPPPINCAATPYAASFPVSINPALAGGALVACMASGLTCPTLANYGASTTISATQCT